MAYTTIDDPTIFFNTILTTGTGNAQAVTGLGFQPDWIWGKRRDSTGHHTLFNSVIGITKGLETTNTNAEFTSSDYYTAFGSDGFTIAAGSSGAGNGSGQTAVQWCWKAGTAFSNDASSTSIGSIDSAGSVNDTAGFSICAYTGVSSAGTIKHGLSTAPSMIIFKNRSASNGWITYHHKNTSSPETDYLELHSTNATADLNTIMADTLPTTSVFSIGTEGAVGGGNTNNFIAFIFSERKGYSKFGSYVGNANDDGTFVYTGFKPAFVMIKNTSAGSTDWYMYDNKRGGPAATIYGNNNKYFLKANTNAAEANETFDMLSNGFKIRITNAFLNGDGNTFIYMAFAESPFVNSNGIPTNAR